MYIIGDLSWRGGDANIIVNEFKAYGLPVMVYVGGWFNYGRSHLSNVLFKKIVKHDHQPQVDQHEKKSGRRLNKAVFYFYANDKAQKHHGSESCRGH